MRKEFYGKENQLSKIFAKKLKSKIDIVRIAINFDEYRILTKLSKYLKN